MCPSYLRLQLPIDAAMRRFARWLALPELGPPIQLPATRSVVAAVEDGQWRGVAVFVGERAGWTVFEDMTGYLAATAVSEWLRLAGSDELIFAGYNDGIAWAELIVLRAGQVIREFREAAEAPEENINSGRLAFETASPISDWVDVAAFVDEDVLQYGLDEGLLWQFAVPRRS